MKKEIGSRQPDAELIERIVAGLMRAENLDNRIRDAFGSIDAEIETDFRHFDMAMDLLGVPPEGPNYCRDGFGEIWVQECKTGSAATLIGKVYKMLFEQDNG